jgi:hypothetical protein
MPNSPLPAALDCRGIGQGKARTFCEARRIAANIAKLPTSIV